MASKKQPKPITLVCFCGKEFSSIARNRLYCSKSCRAKASLERQKETYKAPVKRVRRRPAQTISQVVKELNEYNRTHKKCLTYGQFVAMGDINEGKD